MLSILFFILKLIGIILASILGILIVLLLIVLFVPIRYRIDGKKYDTISLEAKIGWLFRILYCHILYDDNKLLIKFKIFGRLYYDNNNDVHKDKKVRKRKKKNKVRKHKAKNGNDKNGNDKNDRMISKESNAKTIPNNEESKLMESGRRLDSDISMDSGSQMEFDRHMDSDIQLDLQDGLNSDTCLDSDTHLDSDSRMDSDSHKDNYNAHMINDEKMDIKNVLEDNHQSKSSNRKTKRFFRKFKQKLIKIKHFFIEIKEKIVSIIDSIKNIKSKITELWNKWEKIKAFFSNETNKAGIKKIWISIKKLVKHIYPTKLKIELEYGTGDPCDTGQALGVAAAFYGYYGKSIKIIPNFETEIFEGTLHCKGRIRLFTLLIISIKLILDKNFRKLIQNFNSIKEEL